MMVKKGQSLLKAKWDGWADVGFYARVTHFPKKNKLIPKVITDRILINKYGDYMILSYIDDCLTHLKTTEGMFLPAMNRCFIDREKGV